MSRHKDQIIKCPQCKYSHLKDFAGIKEDLVIQCPVCGYEIKVRVAKLGESSGLNGRNASMIIIDDPYIDESEVK